MWATLLMNEGLGTLTTRVKSVESVYKGKIGNFWCAFTVLFSKDKGSP